MKIRTLCAVNVDRNPVSDRNSSQGARKPNRFYCILRFVRVIRVPARAPVCPVCPVCGSPRCLFTGTVFIPVSQSVSLTRVHACAPVRRLLYSYMTTGCYNPQHSSPDRPSTRTLTVAITSPSKRRDLPSTTPPPSFTVPPRAHPSTGSHPAPPLPFDHNA